MCTTSIGPNTSTCKAYNTDTGIGTDTSTSVRGPSSYNGIVGLRPTTGLISRAGIAFASNRPIKPTR